MKNKIILIPIVICALLVGFWIGFGTKRSGLGSGGENIDSTSVSPVSGGTDVVYISDVTDDFAIGGTNSSAALWFDESVGDLKIIGAARLPMLNATTSNIDAIFSTNARIATLNATSSLFDIFSVKSGTTTHTFYVGGSSTFVGAARFGDLASTTGDLFVSGGTFDLTTTTATTSMGVFVRSSETATTTLSVGDTEGHKSVGCLEMVRSDGTYARVIIDGTAFNIQPGRCKD
jgi:hypothetical protein